MNEKALTIDIGYAFKDSSLLRIALIHRSKSIVRNTGHGFNNERLEFLGDAVLSLVTANYLYRRNITMSEGDLSRLRALFVCRENLSEAAKKINLGSHIVSDKAMRASGSNNSKTVLADALEALIGAIFIDGGLDCAEAFIFRVLGLPSAELEKVDKDAKTKLQEIVQASIHDPPRYIVLDSSGPAHSPTFLVGVSIGGEIIAKATGENKKIAAQNAAAQALGIIISKERQDFSH